MSCPRAFAHSTGCAASYANSAGDLGVPFPHKSCTQLPSPAYKQIHVTFLKPKFRKMIKILQQGAEIRLGVETKSNLHWEHQWSLSWRHQRCPLVADSSATVNSHRWLEYYKNFSIAQLHLTFASKSKMNHAIITVPCSEKNEIQICGAGWKSGVWGRSRDGIVRGSHRYKCTYHNPRHAVKITVLFSYKLVKIKNDGGCCNK